MVCLMTLGHGSEEGIHKHPTSQAEQLTGRQTEKQIQRKSSAQNVSPQRARDSLTYPATVWAPGHLSERVSPTLPPKMQIPSSSITLITQHYFSSMHSSVPDYIIFCSSRPSEHKFHVGRNSIFLIHSRVNLQRCICLGQSSCSVNINCVSE